MFRNESRNFFYDITISSPDRKKSARLTDNLLRQCIKVDLVEAIASEELGQGASSLTLTFIENDYLPDSLNKTPLEGVAGRGYTTNRTGALLDIRFDSERGFTYVSQSELQSGITNSSRTEGGESEPISFMFSHNNIIDITWGHLEPRTSRSRRFRIGTVNYATGAGGNVLTLTCYTIQKDLQRLKLDQGKVFVDQQNNPLSLKQCVLSIALTFGARLEFDGEIVDNTILRNYTPPSDYILNRTEIGGDSTIASNSNPAYLIRSEAIDMWMKDLAVSSNSVYEIVEIPGSDQPLIRFNAKKIRYNRVVRTLNYRDPDGVMLEFQYNSVAGEVNRETSVSAVDETGRTESEVRDVRITDARSAVDEIRTFDPIPLVYNSNARSILRRGLVGTSITAPATSESTVRGKSEVKSYGNSFMGFITVKTTGHPDFEPDVMNIQGVGVRASTTYRFFQVQHSLSSAGYFCTMQGKTQESVDQGVKNSDEILENNEPVLERQLINPDE